MNESQFIIVGVCCRHFNKNAVSCPGVW